MIHWIGIDPGANGALCKLYSDSKVEFFDFKKVGIEGYVDSGLLNPHLQAIAIEKVASRTGQGVKSVFSFGQRLGELEGMCKTLYLDYSLVPPQRWQKFCGVLPKSGKQGVYAAVSKLYPHAQLLGPKGGLLDGRCDALGIANYIKHNQPESV
jgi:hypothetical protein